MEHSPPTVYKTYKTSIGGLVGLEIGTDIEQEIFFTIQHIFKAIFSFLDVSKQVQGQTVVITGGSRGIGAAITKQCLQLDMNVIIGRDNVFKKQSLFSY